MTEVCWWIGIGGHVCEGPVSRPGPYCDKARAATMSRAHERVGINMRNAVAQPTETGGMKYIRKDVAAK